MNTQQFILIVEDNKAHRTVLDSLVKGFGFETVVVASGEDAIEATNALNFSAILMDIVLQGGMDGFECSKRIRAAEQGTGKCVPIIAVTSYQIDEAFEAKIRDCRMNDALSKPFEAEALRKVLLRQTYSPKFPNLRLLPGRRLSAGG
jgi:two-component system, sensor histidine kinase and response regulator